MLYWPSNSLIVQIMNILRSSRVEDSYVIVVVFIEEGDNFVHLVVVK